MSSNGAMIGGVLTILINHLPALATVDDHRQQPVSCAISPNDKVGVPYGGGGGGGGVALGSGRPAGLSLHPDSRSGP